MLCPKGIMFGFAAVACLLAPIAACDMITTTFEGSQGGLAARAVFSWEAGGNLFLTLTNTATASVEAPEDVLTGVFFWMDQGWGALTPLSATLGDGSCVWFDTQPLDEIVGGEWAYNSDLPDFVPAAGSPSPTNRGISSTGLDAFGPPDLFPGDNLQGPLSPGGLEYGLVPGPYEPVGNTAVTSRFALVSDSVVFEFAVPDPFTIFAIGNVWFQYGTSTDEPSYPGTFIPGDPDDPSPPMPPPVPVPVPEPASAALLGTGLLGYIVARRRNYI